jgi:hypothetical protein
MSQKEIILTYIFLSTLFAADAQTVKVQQGLLLKNGTSIRLGSVQVLDKRSMARARSNTVGVFNIPASIGDTLTFTSDNFQSDDLVVSDFTDKVVYLKPVIQLDEVIVKEYSLKSDIAETQRGYREKSVFYTGTPHYYYLFLKPMTFIYENFKSEVIDARRFNRYARKELAAYKVSERFNEIAIKKVVPIKDAELSHFELAYFPTLAQINGWNDYDLINYIRSCYDDFKKNGLKQNGLNLE